MPEATIPYEEILALEHRNPCSYFSLLPSDMFNYHLVQMMIWYRQETINANFARLTWGEILHDSISNADDVILFAKNTKITDDNNFHKTLSCCYYNADTDEQKVVARRIYCEVFAAFLTTCSRRWEYIIAVFETSMYLDIRLFDQLLLIYPRNKLRNISQHVCDLYDYLFFSAVGNANASACKLLADRDLLRDWYDDDTYVRYSYSYNHNIIPYHNRMTFASAFVQLICDCKQVELAQQTIDWISHCRIRFYLTQPHNITNCNFSILFIGVFEDLIDRNYIGDHVDAKLSYCRHRGILVIPTHLYSRIRDWIIACSANDDEPLLVRLWFPIESPKFNEVKFNKMIDKIDNAINISSSEKEIMTDIFRTYVEKLLRYG